MSVRLAEYSSFCETCATCLEPLWKENLNVDIRFHRFKTIRLVREDARRGCELCKAITASVRLQDPYFNQFGEIPLQIYLPPAKAWNSYRFIHLNWRPDDVWETLPMVGMHEKYKYRISQVLHPFGEQEIPTALLAKQEETAFGSRTNSSFCQSLAVQWMEGCLKNHPRCRERGAGYRLLQDSRWVPTRLLQILHSGTATTVRLTVVNKNFVGPLETYVTLSHCWGDSQLSQPTRLLTGNLKTFVQGILVSGLPQTFQDAIEVCNWLKIRNIWIDSLCIVQDSDHDWERESKQMHRIYAKALLNIAASGAPNSNAGLFRYRDPDLSSRSVKKLKLPRGNVVLIPEPDILAATIIGGPLAKRGWVLQEQLLACRALYFGEQLFWECTENWACETLPEGPTGMLSLLGNPTCFATQQRISGIISPKEFHYTPKSRQSALYAVWDSICMEYSRRLLTRHSDKEIALSGIAEYFKSLLSEEYIAGLWKGDLIPGLLWFTETSGDLRTLKDIAPSWSWLSPNAEITYASKDRRFGRYVASVSRVSTEATTDDAVGPQTKDISIVLFGVLRPFQWQYSDLNQRPQDSCDLFFDGNIAIPAIGRQSKTARGIIRLDSEENVQSSQLYMCPLVLFEDQDTRQTKLEGLLLTHDGNSDIYHRVGYFEVTSFAQIFYRKLSPTLRKVNSNPWDYFEKDFEAYKASKRNNDFWGLFPHDQEVGISQENNFAFRGRLQQWLESPLDEVFEPLFGQIVEII